MGSWLFSGQWALHKKTGRTTIYLHTTQAKLYILENVKNNMFQSNIFISGCINKYILITGRYVIFIAKFNP